MPKEQDSVRKAILETRVRLRQKQYDEDVHADEERFARPLEMLPTSELPAMPAQSHHTTWQADAPDPDAMDLS